MTTNLDRIREAAFALWQAAGEPEGRDTVFWHQAEREVARDEGGQDKELADTFPASDPLSSSGITRSIRMDGDVGG